MISGFDWDPASMNTVKEHQEWCSRMIPKTNLRPPLVQALNVEVPKHTQKDEYIHSNPIDTHNMEQEFFKKKSYKCRKSYLFS